MQFHSAEGPKSSDRTFGFLMATALVVACVLPWVRRGAEPRWYLLPLAGLFAAAALWIPKKLRPLHLAWLKLGAALHRITSPIFLGLIYFLFFTPIGLLMRLFRRDPLALKLEPDAKTYWIARDHDPGPGMKQQF